MTERNSRKTTMERIENFHHTNELRRKRGVEAVPVLKARLVEQNEFHKQAQLRKATRGALRASLSSVAHIAVKNT
jgi:hypothetical protein